ncbi:MAG: LacI family DNA-binding transcriptional regulator [Victivallales bacterium]|nr:LacI family DNA-binding transcriptional regulator [Victivallales bacterium]
MKKKISLKEVAAAVNLAVPTVSQILNGRKNFCSAEQCQRVRQVAQEMGYVKNIGYRIMTGMETRTIGIMVSSPEQMQEEHFRSLILDLSQKFSDCGYAAFNHTLSSSAKNAYSEIQEYIGRGVERFIFLGLPFGYEQIASMLEKKGIPYVSSNQFFPRYVKADSAGGRVELLKHIDRKTDGHFLAFWWKDTELFDKQIAGMKNRRHFAERRAVLRPCHGEFNAEAFQIGYETTAEILDGHPDIRGVSFPNDVYALGAARCLMDRGITGFHLTGCNGDRELLRYPYPVSTAIFDLKRISDLMAERIFDLEDCQIVVPTRLRLV